MCLCKLDRNIAKFLSSEQSVCKGSFCLTLKPQVVEISLETSPHPIRDSFTHICLGHDSSPPAEGVVVPQITVFIRLITGAGIYSWG